jgi:hypothetical protein
MGSTAAVVNDDDAAPYTGARPGAGVARPASASADDGRNGYGDGWYAIWFIVASSVKSSLLLSVCSIIRIDSIRWSFVVPILDAIHHIHAPMSSLSFFQELFMHDANQELKHPPNHPPSLPDHTRHESARTPIARDIASVQLLFLRLRGLGFRRLGLLF